MTILMRHADALNAMGEDEAQAVRDAYTGRYEVLRGEGR